MANQVLQPNNNNPQGQAHTPCLLVAMEMSLKQWGVALAVEGQLRKRVKTVAGGDYLTLLKAVEEAKQRFGLSADTRVVFCYEAGRDGFFPYRRLTELGHEVWVIDSASIEVSRRRRQAKSDGVDLDKLAELMQRRARGELKALRVVRVPSQEAEDQRALPREREALMHDAQQLRNRIESALFTQGYRDVPKTAKGLQTWMESPTVVLGEQLQERLRRDIERLSLLETQFRSVEQALATQVQQEQVTAVAGVAKALMQLCGIGLIGAWVLASELFGWRKFRNRREVGAILGLTPTP